MSKNQLLFFALLFFPCYLFSQVKDLFFYIDALLNNSPQLYEYRNLIASNRIDSELIVAGNRFQVTGNSNSYYAPVINGWGYDAAITNGQQLSALVAVNKQVYNKKNLRLQFEPPPVKGFAACIFRHHYAGYQEINNIATYYNLWRSTAT